jgi:hypothetical protein
MQFNTATEFMPDDSQYQGFSDWYNANYNSDGSPIAPGAITQNSLPASGNILGAIHLEAASVEPAPLTLNYTPYTDLTASSTPPDSAASTYGSNPFSSNPSYYSALNSNPVYNPVFQYSASAPYASSLTPKPASISHAATWNAYLGNTGGESLAPSTGYEGITPFAAPSSSAVGSHAAPLTDGNDPSTGLSYEEKVLSGYSVSPLSSYSPQEQNTFMQAANGIRDLQGDMAGFTSTIPNFPYASTLSQIGNGVLQSAYNIPAGFIQGAAKVGNAIAYPQDQILTPTANLAQHYDLIPTAASQLVQDAASGIYNKWQSPEGKGEIIGDLAATALAAQIPPSKSFLPWETAPAVDTTTLYRAVSPAEYDSLINSGQFSEGPNSLGGKWFWERPEDAKTFGNKMIPLAGQKDFKIIRIELPRSITDQFHKNSSQDAIGPGQFGTFNLLNSVKPTISLYK